LGFFFKCHNSLNQQSDSPPFILARLDSTEEEGIKALYAIEDPFTGLKSELSLLYALTQTNQ